LVVAGTTLMVVWWRPGRTPVVGHRVPGLRVAVHRRRVAALPAWCAGDQTACWLCRGL